MLVRATQMDDATVGLRHHKVECGWGMELVLSNAEMDQVRALLDVLGARMIDPPQALWSFVTTYITVARWLGVAPQMPRSQYGRAVYLIESDQLARALHDLDTETTARVLKDATFFA